jgi:hypothetical protein
VNSISENQMMFLKKNSYHWIFKKMSSLKTEKLNFQQKQS